MRLRRLKQYAPLCALVCCYLVAVPNSATGQGSEVASSLATSSVAGKVVDAANNPVSGVLVVLHSASSDTEQRLETDAAGAFSFPYPGKGPFQLAAESNGLVVSTVTVPSTSSRPILMKLTGASKSSPENEISFADNPNFTVAGVTDWTAVGGHGSDTTLRTSEDLARTTAALRSAEISRPGAAGSEEQLQAAVRSAPSDFKANLALGEYYVQTAQYARAVQSLKVASAASNRQAVVEYDLALACRGLGDLPEAKQHIDRALQLANRAEYHRLAGELDEVAGDPLAAVQQMERAVQLDASEASFFAWGSELLLHRAILQASQVFARGATQFPSSARLRTGWGTALFAEAQYDQAAQRLCEASDLEPDVADAYAALAKADSASPTPLPCALDRLERHLRLQPQDATAHMMVADALLKRDAVSNGVRAEALLLRATALDPHLAPAFLELGKMAAGRRQYDQAVEYYRIAIVADPQLGEAHFRLAVLYERTGRPSEAKQERELHEAIERREAEKVENDRRSVKQFLVVLQGSQVPATR